MSRSLPRPSILSVALLLTACAPDAHPPTLPAPAPAADPAESADAGTSFGVVRGVVRSAETGEPIHHATVVAGSRRVRTDEEGRFRLCRVSTDTDRVRAVATGYDNALRPLTVATEDSTVVELRLERDHVIHIYEGGAGVVPRFYIVDDQPARILDPSGCNVRGDGDLPLLGLDPADIVSIEIMKGPAAVEAYGPAAAEGVILIRTRSGGPPVP